MGRASTDGPVVVVGDHLSAVVPTVSLDTAEDVMQQGPANREKGQGRADGGLGGVGAGKADHEPGEERDDAGDE